MALQFNYNSFSMRLSHQTSLSIPPQQVLLFPHHAHEMAAPVTFSAAFWTSGDGIENRVKLGCAESAV
jgi:hypothetical protein